MTYTINEHLTNLKIADEDIFMMFGISNCDFDNLKFIGRWFKSSPSTCFRYVLGRLHNEKKLHLDKLKTLYPNVRFVTLINNPWYRVYRAHSVYQKKHQVITLNIFVKLLSTFPGMCPNILTSFPADNSIIFLRNEHIDHDFTNFSKSSNNPIFLKSDSLDYQQFFDEDSNDKILSLFQKDIEFFYPELSS